MSKAVPMVQQYLQFIKNTKGFEKILDKVRKYNNRKHIEKVRLD